jgi:RNA polymerase sigma-70 factor, ECF subfamily
MTSREAARRGRLPRVCTLDPPAGDGQPGVHEPRTGLPTTGMVMTPSDRSDDATLLAAVADGDRTALRSLYERHAPWLTLRLTRRCADPGIVEEVVQDTFVAVWRGARRYRGSGEVAAWVWGIGIRRLIDRLRARPLPIPTALDRGGVVVSAEEQALLGVEHGDLGMALDRLSPELRAVMQATVLDGLTTREAAKLLGIPQGTVKTRLMRARHELREALA